MTFTDQSHRDLITIQHQRVQGLHNDPPRGQFLRRVASRNARPETEKECSNVDRICNA